MCMSNMALGIENTKKQSRLSCCSLSNMDRQVSQQLVFSVPKTNNNIHLYHSLYTYFIYANLFNPYNNSKRQVYDRGMNLSGHPGRISKLSCVESLLQDMLHRCAQWRRREEIKFQVVALRMHSEKQKEWDPGEYPE